MRNQYAKKYFKKEEKLDDVKFSCTESLRYMKFESWNKQEWLLKKEEECKGTNKEKRFGKKKEGAEGENTKRIEEGKKEENITIEWVRMFRWVIPGNS